VRRGPVPGALGALFLVAHLAAAVSAGAAAVTITAVQVTTEASGVVIATGRVRITDGTTVAEAQRAVLDPRRRVAVLTPGTVRGPQGTLTAQRITVHYTATRLTEMVARGAAALTSGETRIRADEIVARAATDQVTATGRVRATLPHAVTAEGTALTYSRGSGRVVLRGPVLVRHPEGTATARQAETEVKGDQVRLAGDVQMRVRDIRARADAATLIVPARRAVLTGHVRVEQAGRVLWGDRVTVDYVSGRVVAEGTLRLVIPDLPTPASTPR